MILIFSLNACNGVKVTWYCVIYSFKTQKLASPYPPTATNRLLLPQRQQLIFLPTVKRFLASLRLMKKFWSKISLSTKFRLCEVASLDVQPFYNLLSRFVLIHFERCISCELSVQNKIFIRLLETMVRVNYINIFRISKRFIKNINSWRNVIVILCNIKPNT